MIIKFTFIDITINEDKLYIPPNYHVLIETCSLNILEKLIEFIEFRGRRSRAIGIETYDIIWINTWINSQYQTI